MTLPQPLTTPRLDLRPPEPEDEDTLFARCFSSPEVMRYLTWNLHRTAGETRALLETLRGRWDRAEQAHWVIAIRGQHDAIGLVSLRLEARANLSYLLAQEHWGKGIMTEAAGSACAWALEQPEIDHLWAFCDTENVPSFSVLSKIGFLEEGKRLRYAVFPNRGEQARDCLLFVRRRP